MVIVIALSVGWVLATALVYWFVARGYWVAKAVMLIASALAALGGGVAVNWIVGAVPAHGVAFAAGAIVFTFTAEALLLVFGMQRSGKS